MNNGNGYIPPQDFEVGDIITWTQSPDQEPLFRLITEVRVYVPPVDEDAEDPRYPSDRRPKRFYTWEYLDRGIDHLGQCRVDEDYASENSTDPQLYHWRRVLRGARRP